MVAAPPVPPVPPVSPAPSLPTRPPIKWGLSSPSTPEAVRAGIVLGACRKGLGVPLTLLAREAALSRSYLSQVERGVIGLTPKSAVRLLTALGVIAAGRLTAAARVAGKEAGDAQASV